MTESRRQWHRLFGIGLTDLFADTAWRVELEKELALSSQLLDVVIIEQRETDAPTRTVELPDGLEDLRRHNLLTYKSRHEALDAWALDELIGHYVNYRKLTAVAATTADDAAEPRLPPETDFQLYAVATREPRGLCRSADCRPSALPGIFDLRWGLHDNPPDRAEHDPPSTRATPPGSCSARTLIASATAPALSSPPTRGRRPARRALSPLPTGAARYVLHHGRLHARAPRAHHQRADPGGDRPAA
jgi:hypothetical protein